MENNNFNMYAMPTQRVLLGLLILIPGLFKLAGSLGLTSGGPSASGVAGMLSLLGPLALAVAWIVVLSEVVFGIAILAKWKMEYTTIPPMIILLVAAFIAAWGNWTSFLFHLVAVAGYWTLMVHAKS